MFLGSYKILFSGKNRLILPKKLRKELGTEEIFYIVKGLDGEIWGFNKEEWSKEAGKRMEIPLVEREGRIARRRFFSQADELVLDQQGRFILPQEFVDFAEINDEVLIIGAGDHIEIWSPERFRKNSEYTT